VEEGTKDITRLLRQWRRGRAEARESLLALIYDRLRLMAAAQFSGERPGHTLQPTALVHEAFLQIEQDELDFNDRRHFFALAARTMRRLLIDHARARRREKRGGVRYQVTLRDVDLSEEGPTADALDLAEALDELEAHNPRVASALELMYFGGMTRGEAAAHLTISPTTLDRDVRLGRAWLKRRLQ
jgi:RNA polymerase sigma factor (TIGR02999 family)